MVAASSTQTSVKFYHNTRHHILEYSNLHNPINEPNHNTTHFTMWVHKTLCKLVVASGDKHTLENCTYLFIYSLFNQTVTTSEYTLTRCKTASHLYIVITVTWIWAEGHTSSAGSYTWQAHQIRKFTLCFLFPKGYSNYLWLLRQNTITVY